MPQPEIDALRARWESDKSPARTLQLAEAYRTNRDSRAALEVLVSGSADHPDHPAAQVAKGRCHLDLDETDAGIRELVKVVSADPSNLLANKLLVEAYTKLGDLARARDRLDLFSLLGGVGSEVEVLGRRIDHFELDSVTGSTDAAEEAEEDRENEPFALPAASGVMALKLEDVGPALAAERRATPSPMGAVRATDAEPFARVDWLDVDEASYRNSLFGEGLFARRATGLETGTVDPQDVAATLTLAELYRRQGHDQEAAGIFREILGRQPGNVEAARGLNDIERNQSWPLSAEDLLGGSDADGDPREGESTVGRLLRGYRARLRGRDS